MIERIVPRISKTQMSGYDTGSLSALEMTAKNTDKVNEVVDYVNKNSEAQDIKNQEYENNLKVIERNKLSKEDYKKDIEEIRKIDESGDFKGSWFGVKRPELTDVGISGSVIRNSENIEKINDDIKGIKDTVYAKKFKPVLMGELWTQNKIDEYGDRTIPQTHEELKKKLIQLYNLGIRNLQICIHIGYNKKEEGRNLYYQTALENIDYLITEGEKMGIKTFMFKFHEEYKLNVMSPDEMGLEEFKNRFRAMLHEVCRRYQGYGIEYMGVFNEWSHFWESNMFPNHEYLPNDFIDFVLECLAIPRSYGFRTGVSTGGFGAGGWGTYSSVDERIYNEVDVFMMNGYPIMSNKGKFTTLEECEQAWSLYQINEALADIRERWGNKPVIHTETGIKDYWECLVNPSNSSIRGYLKANGGSQYLYLKSMMNVMGDSGLLGTNIWYIDEMVDNYELLAPLICEYTNVEQDYIPLEDEESEV